MGGQARQFEGVWEHICLLENERIWMGRLIVMIMRGPVGATLRSIIIDVGNSLKRELNFSLLDLENHNYIFIIQGKDNFQPTAV